MAEGDTILRAKNRLADAFMRIRNSDGGEVQACGNATRCVADLLMKENGSRHVVIETVAGLLDAEAAGDGLVSVDMGPARLDWREIPLAKAMDTLHLDVSMGALRDPVAVNIGNPHAVFFVDDAEAQARFAARRRYLAWRGRLLPIGAVIVVKPASRR